MHFVYVMSEEDRDKMVALGYQLIKSHNTNKLWIFQNKDVVTFSDEDEITNAGIKFVLSDMLTF